jgi:nucleotide-binding universal stress UspA family protein
MTEETLVSLTTTAVTGPTSTSRHTNFGSEVIPADPRVVVAADTGRTSALALAWAADESLCRGMPMRLVTAFADSHVVDRTRTVEQALACQRRLLDQIRRSHPWLDDIEHIVRHGSLLTLLTEAARADDLIVIGANSVTPNLLAHVPCPVVVVPALTEAVGSESHRDSTVTSSVTSWKE